MTPPGRTVIGSRRIFQASGWTIPGILALGAMAMAEPPPDAAATPSKAPLPAEMAQPAPIESAELPPSLPEAAPMPQSEELQLPEEILIPPLAPDAGARPPGPSEPALQLAPPVEIQPLLPPLAPDLAGDHGVESALRVRVRGFRFTGNTVFPSRDLQTVVAKYSGREITSAELEEARQALTRKYVDAGYINSGAVLPDQDLKDGVVVFQIVEGRLTDIKLDGNWWFRPWWLRNAVRRTAGKPLNLNTLKTGLQLLRQNPNLRQINAELEPGGKPGESLLKVDVKENQPFRLGMEISNKRPPSVGAEIVEIQAADLNLTGHSDPLFLRWGVAHTDSETLDRWEFSGLENISGSYEFPVTPWNTRLELHAARSDAAIVDEEFAALDIQSKSTEYGATLRQPFYESLSQTFAASLTAEARESKTFLLGEPFTLSPGAVEGRTKLFMTRFSLEYVNRSEKHVLALRSTVNIGLDVFDATQVDEAGEGSIGAGQAAQELPDSQFLSWLGQAQYVRRIFNTDALAILRLNAQFSRDPLPSLEQFSLGGMASVRGYRENQILRDNGVFASLEMRVPLWRDKEKQPLLTLAPFVDFGSGWDTVRFRGRKPPESEIDNKLETLASVGAGLIFSPWKRVNAQIYWGCPLNRKLTVRDGDNLQDFGIHFTVSVNAF